MYKTLAIYGTNKALYVSIQPKLDIVLKLVTISTSPGIIIDAKKIENIKEAENPIDISKGCPFKNRCKYSMEICKDKKPELKLVSKNHYVACHLNNGEEE